MKKTLTFIFTIISAVVLNAQSVSPEVIASAGESFQGTSMKIDWTLGEIAVTTIQNGERVITQGFHQPYFTITKMVPDDFIWSKLI